jgi:DNA-binding GntR family transcriptional regulator
MAKGSATRCVARHEIRQEIERRILSGETKPGERLSQQSLARELGVAQGTVRESLLELQWLGLVESIDHLGVFVDKLDVSRICEAYQLREVLEGLAARLACRNAGRGDMAELRGMADQIFRLAEQNDTETATLDRRFHMRIIELTRNTTLTRLSQTYRALGMVEAIDHNFAEEAERQARAHVVGARLMIESLAQEGKFVPQWAK